MNKFEMSIDRNSVGQMSENMEFNDERKYSISGNYKSCYIKFYITIVLNTHVIHIVIHTVIHIVMNIDE